MVGSVGERRLERARSAETAATRHVGQECCGRTFRYLGPMTSLVTNVVRGSDADRLMLLVHGYGADERDLGGLLPYLDPDGKLAVVLPRGPEAAPGTPGFAWYSWSPTG